MSDAWVTIPVTEFEALAGRATLLNQALEASGYAGSHLGLEPHDGANMGEYLRRETSRIRRLLAALEGEERPA